MVLLGVLALRVFFFELIPDEDTDRRYVECLEEEDVKSDTDYTKTANDLDNQSESESRSRFRDEVACGISDGNYSKVAPRIYCYGFDGPLRTLWVLMEFISGSTLKSQLPDLNLAQQYAVSELLVLLLQKSHLIRLPASGRIRANPNMKDEGTPCL